MAQPANPVFSVKSEDENFTVYRDDEPLMTPRGLPVTVPTQKLADAITQECVRQGEKLDLRQMPLTQMSLTSIDISAHHRQEVVDGIVRYGESELVCQRATEPAELIEQQNAVWQPYIDWCKATFGADLRTGSGIIPFRQKPESLALLRTHIETYDAFRLTGVSEAVGVSGSLLLGLALVTRHADAATVFAAAELDSLWQAKKWGADPAIEGRHAEIRRDLDMCANWIALLGG